MPRSSLGPVAGDSSPSALVFVPRSSLAGGLAAPPRVCGDPVACGLPVVSRGLGDALLAGDLAVAGGVLAAGEAPWACELAPARPGVPLVAPPVVVVPDTPVVVLVPVTPTPPAPWLTP
jgi:hypothetical protein